MQKGWGGQMSEIIQFMVGWIMIGSGIIILIKPLQHWF